MPTLFFRKACTVLLNAEERTVHGLEKFFFEVGRHDDVPADIAEKPYVQAHLGSERDPKAALPAANSPTTGVGAEGIAAERDAALERATSAEADATMAKDMLVGVTKERDEALARAEKAEADVMSALNAVAELQKLVDEATAPGQGQGEQGGAQSEPDEAVGEFTVRRGYQGTYKVLKGDAVIAEGLTKAEAEAKANEMKAQG